MVDTHTNGAGAELQLNDGRVLTWTSRQDGVLLVLIDVPGETVNTMGARFADELSEMLDVLISDSSLRGAVLVSGKESNFLAGADIGLLWDLSGTDEAANLSRRAQRLLGRLERCRKPVIAAIHGQCLGGGLELALACHYRVATDDSRTTFGFPEVRLGLLPAAGGTQRLTAQVGVQRGLEWMLSGKLVRPEQAITVGLVNRLVPREELIEGACEYVTTPRAGGNVERKGALAGVGGLAEWAMTGTRVGRRVIFGKARRRVLANTKGNYPAPLEILNVVQEGMGRGRDAGFAAESAAFGRLAVSPQARELLGLFIAQREQARTSDADPRVAGRTVDRVAVIGTGLMGAGIAYATACTAGTEVVLKSRGRPGLGKGMQEVERLLARAANRNSIGDREAQAARSRMGSAEDYATALRGTDLVIEAVPENASLKRKVLHAVERHTSKRVIFASNTSAIPISEIARGAMHPERVLGMHYFWPVEKMPLLEIVTTPATAPWAIATCFEFGKRQGKTVIVVRDGPGFYTTRILAPFINEAVFVLEEGIRVEEIDRALTAFGFPLGPLQLIDEVGIDVGASVTERLQDSFGARVSSAESVKWLVSDGRGGRKNARGFYRYDGRRGADPSVYRVLVSRSSCARAAPEAIAKRLVLQMVNEAAYCFGEGTLRTAREGDLGAVLGLGFPPFRGGPFRFIDAVGAGKMVAELECLAQQHGSRFTPAPVLVDAARHGARFYGEDALCPGQHPAGLPHARVA